MTNKMYKGLIALIAVVVANVGVFLLTDKFTTLFWINYVYAMLACVLTIYVNVFSLEGEKPIFGYTLSAISWVYLIAELVVAFVFSRVTPLSFVILAAFLIQFVLLGAFGIVFLQAKRMNSAIKQQQAERGQDILNFKYILECMQDAQRKIAYDAPYRKVVEHAYDSLASGQVRSYGATEVEREILDKITLLSQAIDNQSEEEILAAAKEIEKLSEERKRMLRMRPNF